MTDPVPAIAEADATGAVATTFADIRAVLGIGVVNLVWRHLATIPGGLDWAWGSVRPLYLDGTLAHAATALRAARRLPATPAIPAATAAATGLDAAARRAVADVLDAYDRSNPMALAAMAVLRGAAGPPHVAGPPVPPPAAIPLPPLPALAALPAPVADRVLHLNRIGSDRAEPLLASMWRHLAHWPAALDLAWTLLAPLPGLATAIAEALAMAEARAAPLGRAPVAPPPDASRPAIDAALQLFATDAIARMHVVCGVLHRAWPRD